jgi:hypothetical protein
MAIAVNMTLGTLAWAIVFAVVVASLIKAYKRRCELTPDQRARDDEERSSRIPGDW